MFCPRKVNSKLLAWAKQGKSLDLSSALTPNLVFVNSYPKAALSPILTQTRSLNESPNKPFYPNLLPVTRYRGSTINNTHYFLWRAQLLFLVPPSFILNFLAWLYCIMIYYYKLFPALPFYLSKSLCLSCFLLFFRLPFICTSQLVSDLWIHRLLFSE